MELVNRDGGLGTFRLTETEFTMLGKIKEIAPRTRYVEGYDYSQTPELIAAVHELFPELPLRPEAEQCTFPFGYRQNFLRPVTEFYFRTSAPPGIFNKEYQQVLELKIILPGTVKMDNQYSMAVKLPQYVSGCVDDIVKKLGKREKPQVIAAAPLPKSPFYGIADVDHLDKVLALYQHAVELFEKAPEAISVSKDELWVLRRDGKYHENLVMRELSKERYQEELLKLINS